MNDNKNPKVGDVFYYASGWLLIGFVAGRRDDCVQKVTITETWEDNYKLSPDVYGNILVRYHIEGSDRDSNFGNTSEFFPTYEKALIHQLVKLREFRRKSISEYENQMKEYGKSEKDILKLIGG